MMNHEPTPTESRLDALLRADAPAELSRADAALADRLISGMNRPPRRTVSAPAVVGGGLLAAAVIISASVWLVSRPAPPTMTPPAPFAMRHHSEIDPRVPEAIDNAADDMLDPFKRELEALASISRDSLRNFAGYLPTAIGG